MQISEETKDMLTELINMGVGEASIALSETLNQFIRLTVPDILVLNFDEMQKHVSSFPQKKYVHVVQTLFGNIEGVGVLSFPLENGKALVDTLLQNEGEAEDLEFSSWEIEAIQEVGNMVINSMGMAMADMIKLRVQYTLPEVLFSENIYPLDYIPEQLEDVFCFATTTFFVKNLDVMGCINLVLKDNSVKKVTDILTY